jgi:hypothetical protein
MKKIALVSIATLSMLLAAPNVGMMGPHMKCGSGNMAMKKGMMKKKMNSPFLIKYGLPHLTKSVMQNWKNPAFALTAEQKEKLAALRKETMGSVIKLKPEVMALKKEIVQASTSGAKTADLKEKVDQLASLEAKATMVHLNCIEKTKEILTKDQLLFLLANKNRQHGMRGKMGHKGMKMKCGSGKCGMGMKQGGSK